MVRLLVSGLSGRAVRALRDAGHEVVLMAPGVSADQLAGTAVQEDVVAIALGESAVLVAGGDLPHALDTQGADEIVVFAVGTGHGELSSARPTHGAHAGRD